MKADLKEIQLMKKVKQRAVSPKAQNNISFRSSNNKFAKSFTKNHLKFEQIMDGTHTPQTAAQDVSILGSSLFMHRRKRSQKISHQTSTS